MQMVDTIIVNWCQLAYKPTHRSWGSPFNYIVIYRDDSRQMIYSNHHDLLVEWQMNQEAELRKYQEGWGTLTLMEPYLSHPRSCQLNLPDAKPRSSPHDTRSFIIHYAQNTVN